MQQLRFARDSYSSEDLARLVDFVFSRPVDCELDHTSSWTGQVSIHMVSLSVYTGTSLIRTPMGQKKISLSARFPHFAYYAYILQVG